MADEDDSSSSSSSFDTGGLRSLNTLTQSLTKSAQAFGKSITTEIGRASCRERV